MTEDDINAMKFEDLLKAFVKEFLALQATTDALEEEIDGLREAVSMGMQENASTFSEMDEHLKLLDAQIEELQEYSHKHRT